MRTRTAVQFVMLLGEAALFLLSGTVVYVIISRWAGAAFLGQYSLTLAWIMFFQAFAFFGIPDYLLRELGRDAEGGRESIGHALIIGLAVSALAMLIMAALVSLFRYGADVDRALLLGCLMLPSTTVSAICRSVFLARKRSEAALSVAAIEATSVIVINSYLVLHGAGLIPIVLTLVGAKVVSSLLSLTLLWRLRIPVRWTIDVAFCRTFIPPLCTFAMTNSLGLFSSRITLIMLSMWASFSVIGVFSAANKILELALVLPSIFAQLIMPGLAQAYADRRQYDGALAEKTVAWLLVMTVPLCVGVILFASSLLELLFGAEFIVGELILRLLMVYFVIESVDTLWAVFLKAANRQRKDLQLYLANPMVNVILNIVFIPALGGLGAALAKLLGGLSSFSLRYAYLSRHMVSLNLRHSLAVPLSVSLGAGLVIALLRDQVNPYVQPLVYISMCAFFLYLLHGLTFQRHLVPIGGRHQPPPS